MYVAYLDSTVFKLVSCSMRMPDHQRSKRVWFHDLGIWGYDVINDDGWELKSLSSIKRMLGHEEVPSNSKFCIAIVRGTEQ